MSIRKDVQQGFDAVDRQARASIRVHRRSNTDYQGLLKSLQQRTDGKLSTLFVNDSNKEFDASLLGGSPEYNVSEHNYEQKRSRRGTNMRAIRIPA
jgi:hypothetical protein